MAEPATLQFLGAAGTVTGSKHLLKHRGQQVLLDCGLFQGLKELRLRNWLKPSFNPREVNAVVLSHAHLDHTGYLPLLVKLGFRGPIHCTQATADLIEILLTDSAKIQEEDADRANRKHYSKHEPALPLYTSKDVSTALKLVETHRFHKPFSIGNDLRFTYRRAGHILGAASIEVEITKSDPTRLVFSGDLGRYKNSILKPPEEVPDADIILVEATYGDRIHRPDPLTDLARIINESVERGGALIVPAFAIDRTQELIWCIRQLEIEKRIPVLPVFIDSPMAIEVTDIYCRYTDEHDIPDSELRSDRCAIRSTQQTMIDSVEESKAINGMKGPMIVIAGSGMATGGRVLHHLAIRLPDPKTTVLLAGYQAEGTRGRLLQDGAESVVIHGKNVPVRATIHRLEGLSAHADQEEILNWLGKFQRPPKACYLVHGEPAACEVLAKKIEEELDWNVHTAQDGEMIQVLKNPEWPG
jgi:metallo-beta-lactamase family protein